MAQQTTSTAGGWILEHARELTQDIIPTLGVSKEMRESFLEQAGPRLATFTNSYVVRPHLRELVDLLLGTKEMNPEEHRVLAADPEAVSTTCYVASRREQVTYDERTDADVEVVYASQYSHGLPHVQLAVVDLHSWGAVPRNKDGEPVRFPRNALMLGVFARDDIAENALLFEYVGEYVPGFIFEMRNPTSAEGTYGLEVPDCYVYTLEQKLYDALVAADPNVNATQPERVSVRLVVDGETQHNVAAFINHTSNEDEVNAEFVSYGGPFLYNNHEFFDADDYVNISPGQGDALNRPRIIVRATRDIARGEQLLVSYGPAYVFGAQNIVNMHELRPVRQVVSETPPLHQEEEQEAVPAYREEEGVDGAGESGGGPTPMTSKHTWRLDALKEALG